MRLSNNTSVKNITTILMQVPKNKFCVLSFYQSKKRGGEGEDLTTNYYFLSPPMHPQGMQFAQVTRNGNLTLTFICLRLITLSDVAIPPQFLVCNQSLEIQRDNGMAAMLDDKTKRSVIQHGCHTIIFWISRDWLQTKSTIF